MQPAAWPPRDAQIVERQSALLQHIAADRVRALARAAEAAAAAQDEPLRQGRLGSGAGAPVQPRLRQIDLLTGDQWPAPLSEALLRPAPVAPHGVAPTAHQKPPLPLVRTRPAASVELPSRSQQCPAGQAGGVSIARVGAATPSWSPVHAAKGMAARDGAPESPLDAAPADFLCPISHEVMLDPVLIETGCTFERDALCRWWAQSGARRCPLTGVVVQNSVMAPADELRHQIRAWALRNSVDLRVVAQERIRTAAADEAQRSEQVLLQPSGQSATAPAPGAGKKAKKAAGKAADKKARRDGAARGGGCCCCGRSSDVLP